MEDAATWMMKYVYRDTALEKSFLIAVSAVMVILSEVKTYNESLPSNGEPWNHYQFQNTYDPLDL